MKGDLGAIDAFIELLNITNIPERREREREDASFQGNLIRGLILAPRDEDYSSRVNFAENQRRCKTSTMASRISDLKRGLSCSRHLEASIRSAA